ncbi:MAG: hypothetical protein IPF97_08170 [Sphingomonadales bacterium]|nr:hypothetical protein [Sphingomonadales bacterium]
MGLTDQVSYRVIPMIETAAGFDRDDANASVWTSRRWLRAAPLTGSRRFSTAEH